MTQQLITHNWIALDGTPATGRVPPRLIVVQGQINRSQRQQVEQVYRSFCLSKTASLPMVLRVHTALRDGSKVIVESNHGTDRVLVWPVAAPELDESAFVAFPVNVNPEFAPVFDRPLKPGGGGSNPEDLPEEPVFDVPVPQEQYARQMEYGFSVEWGMPMAIYDPETDTTVQRRALIHTAYVWYGGVEVFSLVGAETPVGTQHVRRENVAVRMMYIKPESLTEPAWSRGGRADIAELELQEQTPVVQIPAGMVPFVTHAKAGETETIYVGGVPPAAGSGVVGSVTSPLMGVVNGYAEASRQESAALAAQFQQQMQDYWALYALWRESTYQDWLDEVERITSGGGPGAGPHPTLHAERASARVAQVQKLRKWLEGGVQASPHLAARFFDCPWEIGSQPVQTLPTIGTVTSDGVHNGSGPTDYYMEFVVAGADRQAIVPQPLDLSDPNDFIHTGAFGVDGAHPLSRDFAMPACLFGWQATGTYRRYALRQQYHAGQPPQVLPHDLRSLSFTPRSEYRDLLKAGVHKVDDENARINSDGYLPAGVRVTVVHFDYEVWDPFSGEWFWTPCVDLRRMDSLWIEGLGGYGMPPPPVKPINGETPRKSRIRGAQTFHRLQDQSWSTPQSIPEDQVLSTVEWTAPVAGDYPPCVVILERLPPTAMPIEGGHLGEALWSGVMREVARQAAMATAEEFAVVVPVAVALKYTKKVKK